MMGLHNRIGRFGTALIVGVALAVGVGGGFALADALTQVDPSTVPQGELALETHVLTPFHLKVGHAPESIFAQGAEVTVEHDSFPAGTSTGWHAHGGPIFVEVVSGTVTTYEKNDPTCTPHVFRAGTGFMEQTGDIHDARNETSGPADIYVEYLMPPGTGDAGLFLPAPDGSNPACPFPN
jgi:quercetin dioxygenase-like cupin family protein